jgi:hypothetical protein
MPRTKLLPKSPPSIFDTPDFAKFRESLPKHQRNETFRFLTAEWDVVKARYIMDEAETGRMDTGELAHAYAIPKERPLPIKEQLEKFGKAALPGFIRVDYDFVKEGCVDLSRPLIFVTLDFDETLNRLLIDGYHRLTYAYQNGVEELQARVLNVAQSKLVRMY